MRASILDLRRHMSRILRAIDKNEPVTLTYRGRIKATIVPKKSSAGKAALDKHPAFGIWSGRKDMKNVDSAVRRLRKARSNAV